MYVLSEAEIIHEELGERYRALAAASIAEFGGRYLARGAAAHVVEGYPAGGRMVLVEFPSMERAREWYASPAYAEALEIRSRAIIRRLVFFEGTGAPAAPTSGAVRGPREEFHSSDAVRELVAAFEDCSLPRDAWTHAAHLAVAAWYVIWHGPDAALEKVRAGITKYNEAYGVRQTPDGGYHETLSGFYVRAVRRHLRQAHCDRSLADLVNGVIAELGDRGIPYRHYSKERLFSWAARTRWIEPDLEPLE